MAFDTLLLKLYRLIAKSPIGYVGRKVNWNEKPRIILAYHGIAPQHPACVSPQIFKEHMVHLREKYDIVPLDGILEESNGNERPMVAITFDDAYTNLLEYAVPVLKDYKIPAIIYAPTNYLGKKNEWDSIYSIPLLQIMSAKDLRMLHNEGFGIGSHTHNHIRLRSQDHTTLQREIGDSKKMLEDITGNTVTSFAYPYGKRRDLDYRAVRFVKQSNYLSAVTTYWGRFNDEAKRYESRRITIWPSDTLGVFKLKLNGNYDWLIPKEIIINRIRLSLA